MAFSLATNVTSSKSQTGTLAFLGSFAAFLHWRDFDHLVAERTDVLPTLMYGRVEPTSLAKMLTFLCHWVFANSASFDNLHWVDDVNSLRTLPFDAVVTWVRYDRLLLPPLTDSAGRHDGSSISWTCVFRMRVHPPSRTSLDLMAAPLFAVWYLGMGLCLARYFGEL